MTKYLGTAIIRILGADRVIAGTGFLVGTRQILTCAHVVLMALRLPPNQLDCPSQPVLVDFPGIDAGDFVAASVKQWRPSRTDGGDIAELELESEPPPNATPVRLLDLSDVEYHAFRAYGFPPGFDNGTTATGRMVGRQLVTSWVQLEDIKTTRRWIQQGYSGAPVWDEQLNGVVGMIVAVDQQAETKTAFMIPTDVLTQERRSITSHASRAENGKRPLGLEDEQRPISEKESRTLRVLAGPGTGKTYSLVRRVARLIERGADPRLNSSRHIHSSSSTGVGGGTWGLWVPRAAQVVRGTLHSFCFSVLRQANVFLQTGRSSRRIVLDFEVRFLLEDLRYGGDFGNVHARRRLLKSFEAAWAREQDQKPGWLIDDRDRQFDYALKAWLRFHEAMLVEEIVPETLRYLRDNPEAPERKQFDHVLVDEYQDLNKAEQSLIDLLRGSGTLSVIGDEDQSIYEGFRYAHPEGITEFDKTHEGTQTLTLEVCRRCPKIVLEMAKSLIRANTGRYPRQLLPKPDSPDGEVHVVQWKGMEEESDGIARFINTRIASGIFVPGQVLILCPRKQFGWLIKEKLSEQYSLPVRSFFHEEQFSGNPKNDSEEGAFAQQAFTLLMLANNPNDRVALRCWLGFEDDTLSAVQYKRLYDHCRSNGQSPLEVLKALCEGRMSMEKTEKLVKRYQALVSALAALGGKTAREAFDELFPSGQDWAEPFRNYVQDLDETPLLGSYIETIRTSVTQPEMPTKADYIRVMSLHKSKGLTAEHVFVMGSIQGLIPTIDKALSLEEQQRALQEQRRLFYVAITRPKRTLVLSSILELPRKLAYSMGAHIVAGNREVVKVVATDFMAELGPWCPDPLPGSRWKY